MNKSKCIGCYNNVYNNGLHGSTECWSLKTAKVIKRKEVHINQIPPWNQNPISLPDCYRNPQYVYVSPNTVN